MPGLVCIFTKHPRKGLETDLNIMLRQIVHYDYYNKGTFIDEHLGLYVGWCCHEKSYADCLPIYSENKDIILIFTGEDYGKAQKKYYLRTYGREHCESNASYLIQLYEEKEEAFIYYLNGQFQGVLIDKRKNKAFLFNDRYGYERLYYYQKDDEYYFACEAKAILKLWPDTRRYDERSIAEYILYDNTLEDRSLFKNIFISPGGSLWINEKKENVKRIKYDDKRAQRSDQFSNLDDYYEELKCAVTEAMPEYFTGKDNIGISLTGGMDCRIILSHIDPRKSDFTCYTYCGDRRESIDSILANKIATEIGKKHHSVKINDNYFDQFQYYAEKTIYISEGMHGVTGSHDLYFSEISKNIAAIRVTGKYGGEILRRVNTHKDNSDSVLSVFTEDIYQEIRQAKDRYIESRKKEDIYDEILHDIPHNMYGATKIENSVLINRSPFLDNRIVDAVLRINNVDSRSRYISNKLIKDGKLNLSYINMDRELLQTKNTIIKDIERFLTWMIFKTEWYYNTELPDSLSRVDFICRNIGIDRMLSGRYKYENYRIWFRDKLKEYVCNILLDYRTRSRSIFRNSNQENIVLDHISGRKNNVKEINKMLSIEILSRQLLDS
jgi:asparagine synthase (glutamine-hydrolysing)